MPQAALRADVRSREERADPVVAAQRAGLRYVRDSQPGIRRQERGKRFVYIGVDGKVVRDAATLKRIQALVIPPAWSEVWICNAPNGHIQSTGRDVKGRKQYRYHTRFRELRDETKYEKMFDFANALPKIRARCEQDLSRPGLARDKVLAAVVSLLEQTLIRVGNEEYSRLNQSFGLTTLRDGHAKIQGASLQFEFRGKSGKQHSVSINDRRLAKIVKTCRDIPGDELFQYLAEDGTRRSIDSSDVNDYLREVTGEDFTAKDFRTFAGTVLAANALAEAGLASSSTAGKKRIVSAIKSAAERLGNTPAVCRKCYVHPGIFEAYLRGRVVPRVAVVRSAGTPGSKASFKTQLRADERAVVSFLKRHIAEVAKEQAPGGLTFVLRRSVQHERTRGLAKTRPRR